MNKKTGQAVTNLGGKVRLMKWGRKNDQAWFWLGEAIVSNSDFKLAVKQYSVNQNIQCKDLKIIYTLPFYRNLVFLTENPLM